MDRKANLDSILRTLEEMMHSKLSLESTDSHSLKAQLQKVLSFKPECSNLEIIKEVAAQQAAVELLKQQIDNYSIENQKSALKVLLNYAQMHGLEI